MLNKGRTAPDFVLPGVEGGEPALYELFRPIEDGELVLLWFLPATFLPTGTAELRAITEAGWHDCAGLQVWVLTMDSIYAAATYADQHEFPMAFLGDAASAASYYDVEYDEWEGHYGVPKRAVFLVGTDWTIEFARAIGDAFERSDPSPVNQVAASIEERVPGAEPPPAVEYSRER